MPPVNLLLHVDLVVRDLERSMAFYLRHLGATVAEDAILRGPVASFYSRGTTDAIRVAFLRLPAGRAQLGHMIELIEVVPKDETALLEAPATASRARFDIRNFTVAVEDIEGTVAEMKRQGVEFLTDILPADLPKLGRSRVAFLADPDGNVVELIEALGLELPKATPEASSGAPLSSADRQFLAGQFNNTDAEFPRDKSFIQLFEEQAERTPEAVAIEHGNMRLTYRELNGRANRWAELLTQLGVGPDAVVPILGERGISLCVSIIAAWKAGAAYLPLDPKHPPDRISQVLEQVSFRAVVVARAQQPLLQQALSQQSLSPAILVYDGDVLRRELVDHFRDGVSGEGRTA